MIKAVWMTVVAVLAAVTFAVAGPPDDRAADETLSEAHEDLQRALETIRMYHLQAGHEGLEGSQAFDDEVVAALRRPRMGILVDPTETGAGEVDGARIMAVTPGGPADEAGLHTGDVITEVDGVDLTGEAVRPYDALIRLLATRAEGDTVTVDFVRDGEQRSTTVELVGGDPDHLVMRGPLRWHTPDHLELLEQPHASESAWFFPSGWLDMELVSLNADLGEYFGTDEGVLVVRGSSDSGLGLRGGDVIVAIDNRVVKSPTHAMRILRSYDPEERLTLDIVRHGRRQSIDATVPEHRVPLLESWSADP